MTARYIIRATQPDGTQAVIGGSNDMTEANRMVLAALHGGAPYAHSTDTRPREPKPVTDAERDALGAITPRTPRTME